jgi:ElaB/YqjD/DUF883 family membrane-anchored ribosome-binding protein
MKSNGEHLQHRTNGDKRPEEILAEIDRTRDEMDRTLSAIEHRLTPGQLVDQGLDYLRHSGAAEFVQNLGGTAKQNPLPIALTAIGIGWLMALGREPAQPNYGSTSTSGLRDGVSAMRDKASGAMHSASDTLASAKDRVSGSMYSMRDRAGQVTESAKLRWDRARGGVDYLVREQPLALGAIGLAVGAILAAMAPRTQKEEELMGEASRNLMEKAKETGSQQLEKAQETVKQVAERASSEGKRSSAQTQGQSSTQRPASTPHVQPRTSPETQTPRQHPGPTAAGPDKKGAW